MEQCRSGLYLKHEPNVKNLLLDIKMIPFAASKQLLLSANPDQLKSERSENNLRCCGENKLTNSKISFLMEMTKVFWFSRRWMLVHKSSASKIAETGLENQSSNLLRVVADKRFLLLHLICLFLVFLLKCSNGSSLPPFRLFAFLPPGGSRRFFPRFPVSMGSTLCVLFYSRCLLCMNHHPAPGKILLTNVGGHAILFLSFLLQLWRRCNQSLLVQETQSAKDLDLTCSTTFLFRDATCLQVGPMSLDCPVNPFGRSDSSRPSFPPDVPSDEHP